ETFSLSQLAALGTLDRHGPMSPGALAAHEKVQPPSMTRILAVLEERGLVHRMPHATDGRQAVVTLTRSGKALLAQDRRRRDAWLSRRLRELSDEEIALLHAAAPVLERLAQQ